MEAEITALTETNFNSLQSENYLATIKIKIIKLQHPLLSLDPEN